MMKSTLIDKEVTDMADPEQHPLGKWFGEKKIVRLMLLAALLALALVHFNSIIAGILFLWRVSSPLILGAVMAYILDIIVKRLESVLFPNTKTKWLAKCRRALAILIALAVVVSILTLIIFTVIPGLTQAITLLAQAMPVYFAELKQWGLSTFKDVAPITDYLNTLEFDWPDIQERVIAWAMNGMSKGLLSSTVTVISAVTGQISNFLISVIFAVFLLTGKRQLQSQASRLIRATLNDRNELRAIHLLSAANRCFSGFIVGQTLSGLLLGAATWIGMVIFRMPYALMVSVLVGTASLIPVIGGYFGAALGTFLVFTASPGTALWFLVFIVVLQTVLGNTVYPRLMGSSVGMPSLWVLAAITLGGGLGGIGGMLAAVPITATIYSLLEEWVRKKEKQTALPDSAGK